MNNSLKINVEILILVTLSTPLCAQVPPANQGAFVISQIRDSKYNLKQAARKISEEADTNNLIPQINNVTSQITTINNQAGISQAEMQFKLAQDSLDAAFATLYNKAYDKNKKSLYSHLYSVLNEIFNDSIIKQKSNSILRLQQEMTQRIISTPNAANHWTKQIQTAGQKISRLASAQIKGVDQILSQAQSTKFQIMSSASNSITMNALEEKLHKKQLELQQALNELPSSVKIKIKQLQDSIQKSNFLLQYIQDPRKAASASPEGIITQETDPAFAPQP